MALLSVLLPIAAMNDGGLRQAIDWFCSHFPARSFFYYPFNVLALLALILVAINCGMVGSLVIGSRMAFFSDALAHCAFAGVSIGFVIFEVFLSATRSPDEFWQWVTPIMVAFGVLVGFGIAFVRQCTNLASDTVIAVFFASAIGLAALLRKLISSRRVFNLEDFLFGDPLTATAEHIIMLAGLTLVTVLVLYFIYNPLLLTGFSNSLALSRRVRVQTVHYVFVILLALIVNLCLRSVGVLLINALMVVPAATAINVTRNLRQLFWLTIGLTLVISLGGLAISWEFSTRRREFGVSGTIILLGVILFALSVSFGPLLRRWLAPRPPRDEVKTKNEPLPPMAA